MSLSESQNYETSNFVQGEQFQSYLQALKKGKPWCATARIRESGFDFVGLVVRCRRYCHDCESKPGGRVPEPMGQTN